MELKLGKMTTDEIAKWFGISKKGYQNKRVKKLKELENFAEFEEFKGGVNITKILIPIYSKLGSIAYQEIKKHVDETWDESGLDTCIRVGYKIGKKYGNEIALSDTTIENYTRRSRNELYGKPFSSDGGEIGRCIYVWCKKYGKEVTAKLEFFTPEENKIKEELMRKYFGDTTEKQIIVKQMIEVGEITEAEGWAMLEKLTNMTTKNYVEFLFELAEKVGCTYVVRGTFVERYAKGAFSVETQDGIVYYEVLDNGELKMLEDKN